MFANHDSYLQQYAKTGFPAVKFLLGILTLTLILSSTFLSSTTYNSDFKVAIPKWRQNAPAQSAVFNLRYSFQ